jgi:hypothetical protein
MKIAKKIIIGILILLLIGVFGYLSLLNYFWPPYVGDMSEVTVDLPEPKDGVDVYKDLRKYENQNKAPNDAKEEKSKLEQLTEEEIWSILDKEGVAFSKQFGIKYSLIKNQDGIDVAFLRVNGNLGETSLLRTYFLYEDKDKEIKLAYKTEGEGTISRLVLQSEVNNYPHLKYVNDSIGWIDGDYYIYSYTKNLNDPEQNCVEDEVYVYRWGQYSGLGPDYVFVWDLNMSKEFSEGICTKPEGKTVYKSTNAPNGLNFEIEYPAILYPKETFSENGDLFKVDFIVPKTTYVIPESGSDVRHLTHNLVYATVYFVDRDKFFKDYIDYDTEANGKWTPYDDEGPNQSCAIYSYDEFYCGHFEKANTENGREYYRMDDGQSVGMYATFNSDLFFFEEEGVGVLFDGPKTNYSIWWSDVDPMISEFSASEIKFINE